LNDHTNSSTFLFKNKTKQKFQKKKLNLLSIVITTGFLSNSRNFDRSFGDISDSTSLVDLVLPPNNFESKPRFLIK
jgi:hypothetical protein